MSGGIRRVREGEKQARVSAWPYQLHLALWKRPICYFVRSGQNSAPSSATAWQFTPRREGSNKHHLVRVGAAWARVQSQSRRSGKAPLIGVKQPKGLRAPVPSTEYKSSKSEKVKGEGHQIWRTQGVQVNGASLRLFLRSSTGPNRAFEPQSLGRVRDPVRIAEGTTATDAATQHRHFGFRLRLVDKLQPIGGGSGRGRPLSGTWETWMAPDVMPTK